MCRLTRRYSYRWYKASIVGSSRRYIYVFRIAHSALGSTPMRASNLTVILPKWEESDKTVLKGKVKPPRRIYFRRSHASIIEAIHFWTTVTSTDSQIAFALQIQPQIKKSRNQRNNDKPLAIVEHQSVLNRRERKKILTDFWHVPFCSKFWSLHCRWRNLWLSAIGGQGGAPKRLLPPKRRLPPPKIFKNNRKNNRNISILF